MIGLDNFLESFPVLKFYCESICYWTSRWQNGICFTDGWYQSHTGGIQTCVTSCHVLYALFLQRLWQRALTWTVPAFPGSWSFCITMGERSIFRLTLASSIWLLAKSKLPQTGFLQLKASGSRVWFSGLGISTITFPCWYILVNLTLLCT